MKYFLRVLLVLVIAVAVVCGFYIYKNGGIEKSTADTSLTTVTKLAATEKNGNKTLIASLKNEGFYLYKSDGTIILEHDSKSYEFKNWNIDEHAEEPKMYYMDFDGDKENEILVRCVASTDNSTKQKIYNLYMLDPKTDSNKKTTYKATQAAQNTLSNILNNVLFEELTQLKSCNKILQFAMNYSSKSIPYDKTTGIVSGEVGSVGYLRALQDSKGNYLKIDNWYKGTGIYTVDDKGKISISVDINIKYKGSDTVQQGGKIVFGLDYSEKNGFYPAKKSLEFKPQSEYKVADPRNAATKSWSYTENNIDKTAPKTNTVIDWISYSEKFDSSVTTQSKSFAAENTDINSVSKIVLTDKYIELTSKPGAQFDTDSVKKREFSVIINEKKNDEYEIAYTATITQSGKSQVLKINFDRAYAAKEIKSFKVNFGIK